MVLMSGTHSHLRTNWCVSINVGLVTGTRGNRGQGVAVDLDVGAGGGEKGYGEYVEYPEWKLQTFTVRIFCPLL